MNRLTARQQEIVHGRCQLGESIDECAYRLGVTRNTVRNHSTDILRRLGMRSFYEVCTQYGRQDGAGEIPAARPNDP